MAIITATPSGSIVKRENKSQLEINKRRAQFEKSYNKKILVVGTKIDSSLMSFSNSISQQIAEFKAKKHERLNINSIN
jgi:hypothetical protein